MSQIININTLPLADINYSTAPAYNMMVKRNFAGLDVSFRSSISSFSNIYMKASLIDDCINSVKSIPSDFENLEKKIAQKDFIEEENIMLLADAEEKRDKLITKDVLENLLTNYLTKDQLSIDIAECEQHATNILNAEAASIATTAAIIKMSEKNTEALEDVTDAISEIDVSSDDD